MLWASRRSLNLIAHKTLSLIWAQETVFRPLAVDTNVWTNSHIFIFIIIFVGSLKNAYFHKQQQCKIGFFLPFLPFPAHGSKLGIPRRWACVTLTWSDVCQNVALEHKLSTISYCWNIPKVDLNSALTLDIGQWGEGNGTPEVLRKFCNNEQRGTNIRR